MMRTQAFFLLMISSWLVQPVIYGQDSLQDTTSLSQKIPAYKGEVPALTNHQFIRNRLVIDPFIKTAFQVSVGIGNSEKLNLPPVTIGDTTINSALGTLAYYNLAARFDLKLNNWISFELRVGGSARIGSEPSSLFVNGLNTITGV